MKLGIYEHYKGGRYEVLGLALDVTNGRPDRQMVVYRSVATSQVYVRDYEEFKQPVEVITPCETSYQPRFRFVSELPPIDGSPGRRCPVCGEP